jgi:plasmid stabilization system protein ParE
MAEIVWSEPALADLEAIAEYIALENPAAASELVQRIVGHVGQLAEHPESGTRVPELERSRYRQLVERPCRVFYRYDGQKVFVLHVMRTERLLRRSTLVRARRSKA